MKTTIIIKGTHCQSCKILIEDVCGEISGIQSCTVNFETGATIIEHTENINWDALKKEIEALGEYAVLIPDIKLFACPECHLEYADETWANKCESWCKEHHSCNLDIIKHAAQK